MTCWKHLYYFSSTKHIAAQSDPSLPENLWWLWADRDPRTVVSRTPKSLMRRGPEGGVFKTFFLPSLMYAPSALHSTLHVYMLMHRIRCKFILKYTYTGRYKNTNVSITRISSLCFVCLSVAGSLCDLCRARTILPARRTVLWIARLPEGDVVYDKRQVGGETLWNFRLWKLHWFRGKFWNTLAAISTELSLPFNVCRHY